MTTFMVLMTHELLLREQKDCNVVSRKIMQVWEGPQHVGIQSSQQAYQGRPLCTDR